MDDTPPSPRYGKRAFEVAVFYYQLNPLFGDSPQLLLIQLLWRDVLSWEGTSCATVLLFSFQSSRHGLRKLTRLNRLQLFSLLIKYSLNFLSLIIQNRNLLRTKSVEEGLIISFFGKEELPIAYLIVHEDRLFPIILLRQSSFL
jgi:hypothetical protein